MIELEQDKTFSDGVLLLAARAGRRLSVNQEKSVAFATETPIELSFSRIFKGVWTAD